MKKHFFGFFLFLCLLTACSSTEFSLENHSNPRAFTENSIIRQVCGKSTLGSDMFKGPISRGYNLDDFIVNQTPYLVKLGKRGYDGYATASAIFSEKCTDMKYVTVFLTNRHVTEKFVHSLEKKFVINGVPTLQTFTDITPVIIPGKLDVSVLLVKFPDPLVSVPLKFGVTAKDYYGVVATIPGFPGHSYELYEGFVMEGKGKSVGSEFYTQDFVLIQNLKERLNGASGSSVLAGKMIFLGLVMEQPLLVNDHIYYESAADIRHAFSDQGIFFDYIP